MTIKEFKSICDPWLPIWLNNDGLCERYETIDDITDVKDVNSVIKYLTIDAQDTLTIQI